MSDMPTGHVWYARADFGKNRFQDQNSTKPTRIDLKLCTRIHQGVGRLPLKDHGPRQTKTLWIKEKRCKSKFSPQSKISPNLWARVESDDFLWWNTSTHVLPHLETTGTTWNPPKLMNRSKTGEGRNKNTKNTKQKSKDTTHDLNPRGQGEVKASLPT